MVWGSVRLRMFSIYTENEQTSVGLWTLYEFVVNLPTHIYAIYTVDITRCYEKIPLEGLDNLHMALEL